VPKLLQGVIWGTGANSMLLMESTQSTLHTAPYWLPLGHVPGIMVPSFTAFGHCVLSAKENIFIDGFTCEAGS